MKAHNDIAESIHLTMSTCLKHCCIKRYYVVCIVPIIVPVTSASLKPFSKLHT